MIALLILLFFLYSNLLEVVNGDGNKFMIGVGNKNYCKETYSKISFKTFLDVIYCSISDPIIKLPNGLTCSQCILQVNLF